ncbi:MAG TPA: helix-turn-helix domain-containing protein [Actinomycetes bacterium]|jgi:DNA-binding PucR family transcriptional regulator|nr:helix-turn-helix domain-containing protein [Actinomycetes bacterium]
MDDRGRVAQRGGPAERLTVAAAETAQDMGLDAALLGEYPATLMAVAGTGRRLTQAELDACRARSVEAAERGVSLRSLIRLYLTVTWRLWSQLPAVHAADRPAVLRQVAEAVLRAADDATASIAAGYEGAQRMAIRLEEALRREFIDDLLSGRGDIQLLVERSERVGLQLTSPHLVAVIHPQQPLADTSPVTRQVEAAVRSRFGDSNVLVATKEGALVCVVPAVTEAAARDLADLLGRVVGERIGIGRPRSGPRGVGQSYEDAREALDLATRLRLQEPVIEADRLVVYRVLLRDRAAIAELVDTVLGPLQRARGGAEPLLATLQAYFAARGISAVAARQLHVGVRTVTYRLQRIKLLTGHAVTEPAQRFALEAAVLGARLLGWPHAPLPAAPDRPAQEGKPAQPTP